MLRTALVSGLAGLCTVAAGATYYSAHSTRSSLDAMLQSKELSRGAIRFVEKSRDTSLMATRGSMEIQFDSSCMEPNALPLTLPVLLSYEVSHQPALGALSRVNARLELTAEADQQFRDAVGNKPLFELQGHVDYGGSVHATFNTATFDAEAPDGKARVHVAASSGRLEQLGSEVAVAWSLPEITGGSREGKLAIRNISLAGKYTDLKTGFGEQTLSMESLRATDRRDNEVARLLDLRIVQSQKLENGMVSASTSPSIKSLSLAGQSFEDLGMRVGFERIDANAFTRLQQLMQVDCREALDERHLQDVERTLLDLVEGGMRFNIDELRGRQGTDHFNGRMLFTLAPASPNTPTLLERARVEFAASASEGLVPPPMVEPFTAQGFMIAADGELRSEVTVADGRVRINGRAGPPPFDEQVQGVLAMGEAGLSGWRDQIQAGEAPLASLTSQLLRQARGS
ncbi:MAG: DUF945 family protein [Burkholderiaceae bacterium]